MASACERNTALDGAQAEAYAMNARIVPKWEIENFRTEAQYVVVLPCRSYQRLERSADPDRTDRRKTGVNKGDFG
jgi:hypothetical protein